jgi:WD40 repeat protein
MLTSDAYQFIMYHKGAIESSPLQAYASALLFSPTASLVRHLFKDEEPAWAAIKLVIGGSWSACLQTLEGHSNRVSSVVFSHDSTKLASASSDKTVKVWDTSSGACLHTLEGHSHLVSSVAFSHDSTKLASASYDKTIKVWDASSGACLQTLKFGEILRDISFDSTSSCLLTEIGTFAIDSLTTSGGTAIAEPGRALHLGVGLSTDNTWIQHDGRNMLWIPSEYRPSHSAVCGTTVGMGVGTGRVWLCSISVADICTDM